MEIKLKNIKYKNVFDNLNLDIKDNEIIGIVGKSGSGKSSIMNMIFGIETNFNHLKDELIPKDITIPVSIKNCYDEIFDYYSIKNNVPSLVYIDDELKSVYKKLLYYFNYEIENMPVNQSLATSDKKTY